MSQYLSGQRPLEHVLYDTNIENLSIIFAGPYSPNPAELLEESLFSDMISKLKEKYDYVIIDTPPMANLIDGAIVARQCDGAVMVVIVARFFELFQIILERGHLGFLDTGQQPANPAPWTMAHKSPSRKQGYGRTLLSIR